MWLILNVIMDWNEFHFMRRYLRAGDTFLDIGANVGIYTLWASQFVNAESSGGRIVAFEPDVKNLSRLREQFALNSLDWVEISPAALSATHGTIGFSQGKDGLNHIVSDEMNETSIVVPTITLDTYCSQRKIPHVNFAKIDVEGAEQLVLAGARQMLAAHQIDVIQLEFNEQVRHRGLSEAGVSELLNSCNYTLYRFDAASNELSAASQIDLGNHENLFAMHDVTSVRRRLAEQEA
jgi:FkbM family methyltransferase